MKKINEERNPLGFYFTEFFSQMITEHQDVFPKKPVRETIFIIFKIILILKTTIIFVSKGIQISHPLYIVFVI